MSMLLFEMKEGRRGRVLCRLFMLMDARDSVCAEAVCVSVAIEKRDRGEKSRQKWIEKQEREFMKGFG